MEDKEQSLVEIHQYPGKHLPGQYLNLVRSRWMRSYRFSNDYMRLTHAGAYYQAYGVYVMSILGRPTTKVRLAVLEEDNDVVLGFGVMDGTCLHYVEVPRAYRRNGIGTHLVPRKIEWFTHLTKIGMKLWSTKAPHARLNPFM